MLNLPQLFARRYLFSKKSHSVINIISGVSAFSVAIPVMAMVILLSVFNGFEGLIRSMYKTFDPDILVTPVKGKIFDTDSVTAQRLKSTDGVLEVSFMLEENALFEYRSRQNHGVLRGVDSLYSRVVPIDSIVADGQYRLQFGDFPEAFVGQGLAYTLGVRTTFNDPLSVYIPRRGQISPLLPSSIYRKRNVFPSGIFALEAETDGKYVITSLGFAQELLNYKNKASAAAVRLQEGASPDKVREEIARILGPDFKVLTRYQQKETFYRIMMYEKWGIYFIILLVLIVASFSLVGSLVMLIIDKRKDMQTLITLGGDIRLIRSIFVREGILIYSIGAVFGMVLGIGFALAQQYFGFIKISAETFLIDAYPVEIHMTDLLWVAVTFTALSYLISKLTVTAMIPKEELRMN